MPPALHLFGLRYTHGGSETYGRLVASRHECLCFSGKTPIFRELIKKHHYIRAYMCLYSLPWLFGAPSIPKVLSHADEARVATGPGSFYSISDARCVEN